ncbi:hypothetical protein [Hyphococcus luteus]|uniref:Transporter n=1 Tax=Hyphococcus luteus TaxID=2058213 RepID=A0A2S7K040_9PROT|nr:hypothetical protein [Marinicaulis flavus]PQA85862.1 hypothetical protein CW354_20220 [Marinicaulis flavus]
MTARLLCIAAFIAVLLAPKEADAYRPFESTDADVVKRGELEIELGPLTVERDDGRTAYIAPSLVANYGLTDTLELVGEFELERPPDESWRVADPGVFLKALLKEGALQNRSGLSIAAEVGALLPESGASDPPDQIGGGGNDLGGEAVLIASGALASFTYHINVGGGVDRAGNAFWTWGVIGELSVSDKLTLAGEVAAEDAAGAAPDRSVLFGARFQPKQSSIVFDLGVRRGLSSASPEWAATAGLTFGF